MNAQMKYHPSAIRPKARMKRALLLRTMSSW